MLHWTVNVRAREAPSEGYRQAAVTVGYKLYSFGGYSCEPLNEHINVYVFNTVSLRWRTLPPVTTRRGERPLQVPCMRQCHTAALVDDTVYIWGGMNMDYALCNNVLHGFDVDAHTWFKPRISGTVPEGRCGHSACVLGKVMYIYGGCTNLTRHITDIYKLDTTTMVWSLINTRDTTAHASAWHSATIIGTKMFVFGGQRDHYNNTRVFDTETNCWLNTPSAQLLPEARSCHSAFTYDGELYIFGGMNRTETETFNDLWKLNPETFSWKEVKPKGNGPLWMIDGCCCIVGDHIILFGGYSNYLHILDLSSSLKTLCKLAVIQYDLEKSELPHDIRWELAAMTDGSGAE